MVPVSFVPQCSARLLFLAVFSYFCLDLFSYFCLDMFLCLPRDAGVSSAIHQEIPCNEIQPRAYQCRIETQLGFCRETFTAGCWGNSKASLIESKFLLFMASAVSAE